MKMTIGAPGAAFKPWLALLAAALISASGCAPSQKIYLKEKDTEHNAPAQAGIMVDRFVVGKSQGPVDVLFVLDNTESTDQAIATFRSSYEGFLHSMASEDARLLDYRVQVAATPGGRVTQNFVSAGEDPANHLAELFTGLNGHAPLLTARDHGFPHPFESTASGLSSKAFEKRPHGPLFLVYLLGGDTDGLDAGDTSEELLALQNTRGLYQTHVLTLSRTSAGTAPGAFPYCDTFQAATRILSRFHAIAWQSNAAYDLCDGGWGRFSQELFQSILAQKKRLVLSQVPYQPETMVLRGSARRYRYGDDYRYDAQSNEITFLTPGLVEDGDLLELAYYLEPTEQVFQGSPSPNPLTSPLPDGP